MICEEEALLYGKSNTTTTERSTVNLCIAEGTTEKFGLPKVGLETGI
jgi:hypothetical protein